MVWVTFSHSLIRVLRASRDIVIGEFQLSANSDPSFRPPIQLAPPSHAWIRSSDHPGRTTGRPVRSRKTSRTRLPSTSSMAASSSEARPSLAARARFAVSTSGMEPDQCVRTRQNMSKSTRRRSTSPHEFGIGWARPGEHSFIWSGPGDTTDLTSRAVEMVPNLASVAAVATPWFWRGCSLTGLASRVGESLGH